MVISVSMSEEYLLGHRKFKTCFEEIKIMRRNKSLLNELLQSEFFSTIKFAHESFWWKVESYFMK